MRVSYPTVYYPVSVCSLKKIETDSNQCLRGEMKLRVCYCPCFRTVVIFIIIVINVDIHSSIRGSSVSFSLLTRMPAVLPILL